MSRHRRRRIGLLVWRSTYRSLWLKYAELEARYRALETDHQAVLEDHEGLLFDMEAPGPLERTGVAHTPSWAETDEIPIITSVGLDLDKADALTRRTGLHSAPSGAWDGREQGTTG